ncbi:MAG: hypothetical protein FWF49_00765, partial [Oscillospiraceae bacterium]|nr:hypothetical protein [Oscillospiraceae bacterium]
MKTKIAAAVCMPALALALLCGCVPLADATLATTAPAATEPLYSNFPAFDASQYAAVPSAAVDYNDARALSLLNSKLNDTSLSLHFLDPKLTDSGMYCIEADKSDGSVYGYYQV